MIVKQLGGQSWVTVVLDWTLWIVDKLLHQVEYEHLRVISKRIQCSICSDGNAAPISCKDQSTQGEAGGQEQYSKCSDSKQ